MNDESALLWALFSLAYTAGEQGSLPDAVAYLRELLGLSEETQNRRHLYLCGVGVLWRLRDQGDPEQLARRAGARLDEARELVAAVSSKLEATLNACLAVQLLADIEPPPGISTDFS